jgi:hypothetical protein
MEGITGELICRVCWQFTTTLVHCLCGWRSCQECYGTGHPHPLRKVTRYG